MIKPPYIIGAVGALILVALIILRIQHPLLGGGFYSVQNNLLQSASTTPGGADSNVQFNQAGAFGGSSQLTWINSTSHLGVGTTTPGASLTVDNGNIYIASSTLGEVRKLPNGSCLLYTVANTGAFVTSSLSCP